MKEHLRRLVARAHHDAAGLLLAREYLQARILESLQDSGVFARWALLGGTALRFLHELPRFSEDLEFSLRDPGASADFRAALSRTQRTLVREGYHLEVRVKDDKTVVSAMIAFPGLPYELGLSARRAQKLSIKVELDTNPPVGAKSTTTLVRRHVTLNLCHHDRPSLLAGKLHAVLCRPWTKGRDLFDLAWYLADRSWPPPNLGFLQAALIQSKWKGAVLTADNWRHEVRARIDLVDWYAVFLHAGAYEGFQQTYDQIFKAWLPGSGEKLREKPCFEVYLNSPDQVKPEDLRTEIWLPLQ